MSYEHKYDGFKVGGIDLSRTIHLHWAHERDVEQSDGWRPLTFCGALVPPGEATTPTFDFATCSACRQASSAYSMLLDTTQARASAFTALAAEQYNERLLRMSAGTEEEKAKIKELLTSMRDLVAKPPKVDGAREFQAEEADA